MNQYREDNDIGNTLDLDKSFLEHIKEQNHEDNIEYAKPRMLAKGKTRICIVNCQVILFQRLVNR